MELLDAVDDAIARIEAAARRSADGADQRSLETLAATGGIEKYERRRNWWMRHQGEFAAALR